MALGVGVFSIVGFVFTVKTGDPAWLFFGLPFTGLLWVTGRYAPTGYRLEADGVHVDRRAGPFVIPYRRIRGADREPRRIHGMTVLGSRGVFGRFGRFWNMQVGVYRLFLTNTHGVVWLATDDGLVGLSPDRPDEFVERLRARLALLRR